ncbi:MAG TPA: VOC family protein [Thermomicrobiales bacterium]|jgi:predicted 3-demethylubiquinone-9 3-methyltransferase (glyoxalase superfamily)|nr:VOC family protein [Thermomicrobiales bacterium]
MTQKIRPFLWFDGNAEEAVNFYLSVFPDARLGEVSRYGEGMPMPAGTVLVANFTLFGQEFGAINAGPEFKFTEAISFMIDCKDQAEVDYYWDKLTADGGEPSQCGWLKDKYGLSWQVVPSALGELMTDPDPAKANRVTQALMQMSKIDVAKLEAARDGA